VDEIRVKLGAIKQEPKEHLRSILRDWINSSKEGGPVMLSKEKGFWLDSSQNLEDFV
jgi:hypothetical protein